MTIMWKVDHDNILLEQSPTQDVRELSVVDIILFYRSSKINAHFKIARGFAHWSCLFMTVVLHFFQFSVASIL